MMEQAFIIFMMFLLIIVRIVGVFIQAPIWGSQHIPKQILAGTISVLALNILMLLPINSKMPGNLTAFGQLLLIQFLVGLVIGYVSYLVMAGAQFAGELLDIQLGLSTAASFDPAAHGTINLIRRFKFYLAMLLYLIFDGHHELLKALYRSFEIVPLNGINFSGKLINNLIAITNDVFIIGIQLAAPMLLALFVTQVALGLLSRVAPQMNVFMLSFPLNILIGLSLLWISLPFIKTALRNLFALNMSQVLRVIWYMK
ncbi:MAG: flagellar biosynthetic protein FliR [Armatimonadetes bacterium]|nr:flagellar biosynthetic protein FliR [Armatimonadota bacterium]